MPSSPQARGLLAWGGVRRIARGQQFARDQVLGVAAHGAVGAVFGGNLVADAGVMFAGRPDRDRQADKHRALTERAVGDRHDEGSFGEHGQSPDEVEGRDRQEGGQARPAPLLTAQRVKAGWWARPGRRAVADLTSRVPYSRASRSAYSLTAAKF